MQGIIQTKTNLVVRVARAHLFRSGMRVSHVSCQVILEIRAWLRGNSRCISVKHGKAKTGQRQSSLSLNAIPAYPFQSDHTFTAAFSRRLAATF